MGQRRSFQRSQARTRAAPSAELDQQGQGHRAGRGADVGQPVGPERPAAEHVEQPDPRGRAHGGRPRRSAWCARSTAGPRSAATASRRRHRPRPAAAPRAAASPGKAPGWGSAPKHGHHRHEGGAAAGPGGRGALDGGEAGAGDEGHGPQRQVGQHDDLGQDEHDPTDETRRELALQVADPVEVERRRSATQITMPSASSEQHALEPRGAGPPHHRSGSHVGSAQRRARPAPGAPWSGAATASRTATTGTTTTGQHERPRHRPGRAEEGEQRPPDSARTAYPAAQAASAGSERSVEGVAGEPDGAGLGRVARRRRAATPREPTAHAERRAAARR